MYIMNGLYRKGYIFFNRNIASFIDDGCFTQIINRYQNLSCRPSDGMIMDVEARDTAVFSNKVSKSKKPASSQNLHLFGNFKIDVFDH